MNDVLSTTPGKVCFFQKKMQIIIYVFLSLFEDNQQFKFVIVMTSHLTLFLAFFQSFFVGFSSKTDEY
jgi:hypothetical protein